MWILVFHRSHHRVFPLLHPLWSSTTKAAGFASYFYLDLFLFLYFFSQSLFISSWVNCNGFIIKFLVSNLALPVHPSDYATNISKVLIISRPSPISSLCWEQMKYKERCLWCKDWGSLPRPSDFTLPELRPRSLEKFLSWMMCQLTLFSNSTLLMI